jgi:hypothetical protein
MLQEQQKLSDLYVSSDNEEESWTWMQIHLAVNVEISYISAKAASMVT